MGGGERTLLAALRVQACLHAAVVFPFAPGFCAKTVCLKVEMEWTKDVLNLLTNKAVNRA